MKTFVILLSCLVCCVTAGRLGLTQKLQWLDTIRQGQEAAPLNQGYTLQGTDERQQFLLDVLIQVQKPLVNTKLIQLGQVLVTDPNMYVLPNDEILQEFLQQASNQEILGRNDAYNPIDLSNIRQLVGLQRFFVLARDFYVFQRNVVYARLHFNAVLFVDALSLAIRERPDTQDLVMPPMNEILPQLYYDNYVINSAQNVDYNDLITQATRTNMKPSPFDVFGLGTIGSLFKAKKYSLFNPWKQWRMQIAFGPQRFGIGGLGLVSGGRRVDDKESGRDYLGDSSDIEAAIVLPVGERDGLSTDLTKDIDLNVAWNNIIIDQLAQTITEGIEGGQQIGGIGSDQQQGQYYLQGEGETGRYSSDIGGGYDQSLESQEDISAWVKQSRGSTNELPQVDVNSQRLLRVGRRRRVNALNGEYSYYVYPFYRQQNQYGYNNQEYGSSYPYGRGTQYGYEDKEYPHGRQQNQGAKYGYKDQEYSYGRGQSQGAEYGYKNQQYPYGREQNQGVQCGYKDQKYPCDRQQNRGAQYGYKDQEYGSYYGYPYGSQQNQGAQYGYKNQEYPYGREQNQGVQCGYKDQKYPCGRQQNRGAQYGYRDQEFGYGSKSQQQEQYQHQKQQAYRVRPYGQQSVDTNDKTMDNEDIVVAVERQVRDRGESGKRNRSGDRKRGNYRHTEQYYELEGLRDEIMRSIAATQQVSYSRRGEILLQSIQDLAARLNMQRIVVTIEGARYQHQQYPQVQQEIDQIMQQLRKLIEQVRQEAGISKRSEETLSIVASIINGRIILEKQKLSIEAQRTLQALQQQIQRIVGYEVGQVNEVTPLALLADDLRNPVTQQTILSLAQLIDEYRQQLQPYTKNQLSGNGDIAVQNVQIDPLVTYTEVVDADLVNLIDQQLLQSNTNNLERLEKKVVARQQRLNYEPFTISMDIQSNRQQEVDVRILLGPKIDSNGRRVSLKQNRQNFILLDDFVQQLQAGDNNIRRDSRQFNGYSSEVSTISQIYRQVMTGQKQQQQSGTIRQLPQHLLLPRGTTVGGGLPVEIMVVVTPLTTKDRLLLGEGVNTQQISGFGIAGVGVTQLPLGYPLDRPIVDEQRLDVPNILTTETVIQYDSRIRA